MSQIAVFCGSSQPRSTEIISAARLLGHRIGSGGHALVYGGSNLGLMGEVSESAMKSGAKVTAVIPRLFPDSVINSQKVHELIVVASMAERKERIIAISDIFIALPGGIGTLDEVTEVMVANQLRQIDKPVGLFNIGGFFDHFLHQLDIMTDEGLLQKERLPLVWNSIEDCNLL